jgi:Na+/H+-dicarboxylate symporter
MCEFVLHIGSGSEYIIYVYIYLYIHIIIILYILLYIYIYENNCLTYVNDITYKVSLAFSFII